MSEAQDIIKAIEEKNQIFHGEYKEALDKQGNEYKESIVKMDAKLNELQDTQDKLEKSIKAQTIAKEMDATESNRKQVAEFAKNLRALKKGEMPAFETEEMKSVIEAKNYNSGDDSVGGVFVMPFIDSMLGKLLREYSDPRSLASVSSITTDKWEQIVMNKVNGAVWEKDMANFTDQTKNNRFDKINMMIEDLHAIAIFNNNLIDDAAFDIVGEIMTDIAEDFAIAEGLSYFTGDGVGELNGILNTPNATGSFNGIERVVAAGATAITMNDIYDLTGSLIRRYQPRAQFKANRATITELRKLKDTQDRPLWEPSNQAGVPNMLAGYPISEAQELSATLTTGVESVVFGDFGQATKIIDRMGMTVLRDPLTQYPNTAFKVKKRLTGGTVKGQALKILKQA